MGNAPSSMLRDDELKKISQDTGFCPAQIEKLFSRFAHLDRTGRGTLGKDDLISIPELAINPLGDRLIDIFFQDCDQDGRINFRQFIRTLALFKATRCTKQPQNSNNLSSCRNTLHQSVNQQQNTRDTKQHIPPGKRKMVFSSSAANKRDSESSSLSSFSSSSSSNTSLKCYHGGAMREKKLEFLFKIYDADSDGRISFNDLRNILKMMVGNFIEDVMIDKIATRAFAEVDADNDGYIDFDDFSRVLDSADLEGNMKVKI